MVLSVVLVNLMIRETQVVRGCDLHEIEIIRLDKSEMDKSQQRRILLFVWA